MLDSNWFPTEKKVDPNFEGSIFQELGFEARLCPICSAHLYEGICLNACHLTRQSKEHFVREMNGLG